VDLITPALELAHAETKMDAAVLGEVCDGREVVRFAAGDPRSFGLAPSASMPIQDTYCHRLLTGRISNFVPDARGDEQLRDLKITRTARVGAYLGVPLTGLDARSTCSAAWRTSSNPNWATATRSSSAASERRSSPR
jgi:hypothetical protein